MAIQKWEALPPNPGGWIVTTARNRAIDRIRRDSTREARHAQALLLHQPDETEPEVGPKTRSGSGAPGAPRARRARGTRRSSAPAGVPGSTTDGQPPPVTGRASEFQTEVRLKAGRVVLTVDVNPIELRGIDRTFFFDLVDKMEAHAARIETSSACPDPCRARCGPPHR